MPGCPQLISPAKDQGAESPSHPGGRLHVTTPGGLHSVREEMKRATDDINLLPVTPARTKYRKEPGNNGLLDGSSSFDFEKRRFIVTD